jgi:hypothetical protein
MKRKALFCFASIALLSSNAYGQNGLPDKQSQSQQQSSGGVIVQAIQPAFVKTESNQVSSLIWIYDTNTKQVMLCSSRVDMEFSCTKSVRLAW